MQMHEVDSSNISSIGWDNVNGLRVKFSTGAVYDYPAVSFHVFQELMQSDSKGRFFDKNIKGTYQHVKV